MLARNSLLARLAASAASFACWSSSSACLRSVMSNSVPSINSRIPAFDWKEIRVLKNPHGAPVPAHQAPFEIGKAFFGAQPRDKLGQIVGTRIGGGHGIRQQFVAGGVSEDPRAGVVAVEDAAIQRDAVNPRQTPLEKKPVTLLGGGELRRLRGVLAVDNRGDDRKAQNYERHHGDSGRSERGNADGVRQIGRHSDFMKAAAAIPV